MTQLGRTQGIVHAHVTVASQCTYVSQGHLRDVCAGRWGHFSLCSFLLGLGGGLVFPRGPKLPKALGFPPLPKRTDFGQSPGSARAVRQLSPQAGLLPWLGVEAPEATCLTGKQNPTNLPKVTQDSDPCILNTIMLLTQSGAPSTWVQNASLAGLLRLNTALKTAVSPVCSSGASAHNPHISSTFLPTHSIPAERRKTCCASSETHWNHGEREPWG